MHVRMYNYARVRVYTLRKEGAKVLPSVSRLLYESNIHFSVSLSILFFTKRGDWEEEELTLNVYRR